MSERGPSHGFRCSGSDVAVVAVGGAATWAAWGEPPHFAALIPVVLGHFFLFCNVFRIGTRLELGWTTAFVVNFTAWLVCDAFTWAAVLATQAPITVAVLGYALVQPGYHGVLSRSPALRTQDDDAAACS